MNTEPTDAKALDTPDKDYKNIFTNHVGYLNALVTRLPIDVKMGRWINPELAKLETTIKEAKPSTYLDVFTDVLATYRLSTVGFLMYINELFHMYKLESDKTRFLMDENEKIRRESSPSKKESFILPVVFRMLSNGFSEGFNQSSDLEFVPIDKKTFEVITFYKTEFGTESKALIHVGDTYIFIPQKTLDWIFIKPDWVVRYGIKEKCELITGLTPDITKKGLMIPF